MDICGEIEYNGIHSDICIGHNMNKFEISDDTRQFLHDNLDEWFNNSNGNGGFWIGNCQWVNENFK